jgi:hypothetical protein
MREIKVVKAFRVTFILTAIGVVFTATGSAALAAPNCAEFFSNADGSWSPTHPILIAGATSQTQIMPSDKFRPGMPGLAGRIAASLNHNCRYARSPSGPRNIPRVP